MLSPEITHWFASICRTKELLLREANTEPIKMRKVI